ncbi:outer membrane protein assembly factor BamE [Halomonas sp. Bachu 37]|uniref:outer membrane protein assembly factor BamE n=1 Tax=Halomonas kashgarensis TaxID=3084920 RepID=UPI0032176C88
MQKLTRIITLSATLLIASGCSYLGVYKRDVPQGNLVTQDMVQQLQPGMSQQQVAYIMGRPLLEAPFDADQWDYVFHLDKAYGGVEQRRVTLQFDPSGRLSDIRKEGDFSRDPELRGSDVGPATEGSDPVRVIDQKPETPATAPEPVPVPAGEL